MNTATVAELEQKILDGGTVSPGELAQAKINEAAAGDISRLRDEAAKRAEQERRTAEADSLDADLSRRVTAFAEAQAAERFEIETGLDALAVRYRAYRDKQNEGITKFREEVAKIRQLTTKYSGLIQANDESGGLFFPNGYLPWCSDWENDLLNLLTSAREKANGREVSA